MDIEHIRSRFSMRASTSSQRINPDSQSLIAPGETFVDAAVLVPLLAAPDGLEVLLTRRAEHLKHHPGQVSFPGGRREPADASLEVTALRETHEETGIAPEFVEIIGHLPRMYTISAYDVDPVVGFVRSGFTLAPDPSEVEELFSVPLSHFQDGRTRIERDVAFRGTNVPMVEWEYADQRIWGATAAMIRVLVETLGRD